MLIKALIIRLIPFLIFMITFAFFADIPASKVPEVFITFIAIFLALTFFYSIVSIVGFLKAVFKKVFGIPSSHSKKDKESTNKV